MKIISEDTLDQIVERFDDSDQAYVQAVEQMEAEQPVLLGYLFSDEFEAYTQDEKEYLLMLATIIFTAIRDTNAGALPAVTAQALSAAEEQNWAKLEGISAKSFNERMDIFFENYVQEELLAFVEDALADDDEDPIVTKEAREPLFVTLKTIIDCLSQAS